MPKPRKCENCFAPYTDDPQANCFEGRNHVWTEKQASSEIAQSRERFEKAFGEPLFDGFKQDSTGMYYSREARRAWEVWQMAERDTRERIVLEIKEMSRRWRGPGSEAVDFLVERIRGKE